MNSELTLGICLCGLGVFMMIFGLSYRSPAFHKIDIRTFQYLHAKLRVHNNFFQYIWPLGTTPVAILLISITYLVSWQAGLIVTLVYCFVAIIEHTIKLKLNRKRPFQTLPDTIMSQPKSPADPSHPSGDAMRVWFLALVFPL